jgi:hypothetical protein
VTAGIIYTSTTSFLAHVSWAPGKKTLSKIGLRSSGRVWNFEQLLGGGFCGRGFAFFFLDSEFAVCTFLRGFHRWGFCKVYTHGRNITGGFILCFSRRKITSNFDSTSCQIGLHTTPASAEFLGVSANSACHRPRSGDGGHSNGRDKQDPKTRYVTGYISSFAKRVHLYAERTAPESGTC